MTETGSDRDNNGDDQAPPGWRYVPVSGRQVLMLKSTHPDYPPELRERAIARDDAEFGRDPAMRAALSRLAERFANADRLLIDRVYPALRAGDMATVDIVIDEFTETFVRWVADEERALPPIKKARRRLIYLMRRANELLPETVATAQDSNLAPYAAPFLVLINTSDEPIKPVLNPAETAIHLDRFMTGDLPKLGRIITEAQVLAGQIERAGKGGRPKLPDMSNEAATPEMVAKLRYWEGWSYRRIAAFLGWLRSDEDWRNEKIRRRVEQRVRRWVREGEDDLRRLTPDDRDWKTRPGYVERAVEEERPRV